MAFTKDELEQELREFIVGFACSLEHVFRVGCGELLGYPGKSAYRCELGDAKVENTWLWPVVRTMYDFGVRGIPSAHIGNIEKDDHLDGEYADVELFLRGLDSLEQFFEECNVRLPRLSLRTVKTAVARHVLNGGSRFFMADDDEVSSYISFAEIALLADMDERSVRNAANPKLPDALVTTNFGRRTLIHIDDARKWLAGRKGFVPNQSDAAKPVSEESKWSVMNLPYPLISRIHEQAEAAGIPSWELVERLLDRSQTGGAQ